MTFRKTSISVIAALAVSTGGALAQSGDASFCEEGFSRYDPDSSGTISEQELTQATEWEFSQLDTNGDGMVSQEEYIDCRSAWNATVDESVTQTLSEEDVTVLDRNADGKVDQAEFMDAADQEYMARWSETGTEKEVRDADFAPATPENEGGVGGTSTDTGAGDTQADASGSTQTGDDATQQQSAEAQKATGEGAPQSGGLILRRIIFLPQDGKPIGEMSRDEIAQRSARQFILLDTDSNKAIEPGEQGDQAQADAADKARAVQAMVEQNMNQRFDRADADRSGDISREEYTADARARWQQAQERASSQNTQGDAGAPVVLFHYPHPM